MNHFSSSENSVNSVTERINRLLQCSPRLIDLCLTETSKNIRDEPVRALRMLVGNERSERILLCSILNSVIVDFLLKTFFIYFLKDQQMCVNNSMELHFAYLKQKH
ncbi:hypothetical protein ACRRTK_019334 [Alexandromys fortis]